MRDNAHAGSERTMRDNAHDGSERTSDQSRDQPLEKDDAFIGNERTQEKEEEPSNNDGVCLHAISAVPSLKTLEVSSVRCVAQPRKRSSSLSRLEGNKEL